MLLALTHWAIPTPVQAKIETKVEIKQEAKEPINEQQPNPLPHRSEQPKEANKNIRTQPSSRRNNPPKENKAVQERPDGAVSNSQIKNYSKEDVIQLIKDYSIQYGINAEVPLCIAKHESGYNQFAKNKSSSASGVMQFLSGTWRGTDEGRAGLSVFDADANVRAAIKYMASRRSTKPWEVRSKCPNL